MKLKDLCREYSSSENNALSQLSFCIWLSWTQTATVWTSEESTALVTKHLERSKP